VCRQTILCRLKRQYFTGQGRALLCSFFGFSQSDKENSRLFVPQIGFS